MAREENAVNLLAAAVANAVRVAPNMTVIKD